MSLVAPTLPSNQSPLGKGGSRASSRRREWSLAFTLIAFGIVFLPVFLAYLQQLWVREYYRFFPFAIGATILLAFARTSNQPGLSGSAVHWTLRLFVFLLAECSLVAGILLASPLLCFLASVLVLGLIMDFWGELGCNRSLAYLILPTVLTVRPPLNLDESAIHSLQRITSKLASSFLSAVNVDHILAGNVIQPLIGPALMVEEACSGVQSLFTLMFIAAFMAVYRRYAFARSLLLIGTAVFWALILNVFRVVVIALAQTQLQLDLTSGWKHEAVGYVGILLAVGFLFSTDRLLLFFFAGIPDDPMKNESLNVFVSFWNWLFVTPGFEIPDTDRVASKSVRTKGEASQNSWSRWHSIAAIAMACIMIVTTIPSWSLPGLRQLFGAGTPRPYPTVVTDDVPVLPATAGGQQ